MIDWEQEVEIKWSFKYWKWYVEKGYVFTNWGDEFKVKAKDLYPNSGTRIEYSCDICGKKQKTPLYCYNKIKRDEYGDTCKKHSSKKTNSTLKENRVNNMYSKICNMAKLKNYELLFDISEYENQKTKIKYICPKHGEQETAANHFVRGECCRKCGEEKVGKLNRLSINEVINRVENMGCKLLNPNDYETNNKRNLLIQCSCGETFYGCINEIEKRYRCGKCSRSESVGENIIRRFLDEHNINYIPQYRFKDCKDKRTLPFDFCLPDKNICIEFDGKHHSEPILGKKKLEYVQKHDKIKDEYCINHNINLIRIKYTDRKKIDSILTKELLIM